MLEEVFFFVVASAERVRIAIGFAGSLKTILLGISIFLKLIMKFLRRI